MLGTLLLRGGKPVLPQHRARWLFGEGVGGEETEHGRVITRGPRRWHGGPSRRGRRRNSRSGGPPPANCVARTRPGWGSRGPRPGRASSGSSGEATRGPAPVNGKSRKRESPASAARLGPPMAAGPELPRQPGARSQGQACEIRNGAPLPGSDFGEGARSKWREAAAGDGEGAYTDVRDRAGYGENEAPRRLSPRPTPPAGPCRRAYTGAMDPERTMEFLLQQAARAEERANRADERMDRFEREMRLMFRQGTLLARRAFEQIRQVAEQQKETEARLNAVIALVERKFGGNGAQPA